MPGSITIPPHLIQFVASTSNSLESASEALEEWILHRRGKGDTLFEVSVGLAELEDRTPPHSQVAFSRARYNTNVPPPSDLTPPTGPFPLSRSASPVTILHHLLSQPPPSIEHSREVILEYVLSREAKLREKKPGRGGKGTLGRDGFEDIANKLAEVEDGLRLPGIDTMELSANRQLGLALILSLRMSLSYFTSQELGDQLLKLGTSDAERVIVQHIRKRAPGEGRYVVGKELEHLEDLTARRLALRPAFRSARARTTLPDRPLYQIPLPTPSKSTCIKLISGCIKENADSATATAGAASAGGDKAAFASPSGAGSSSPAPFSSTSLSTTPIIRRTPLPDSNPIAHYVFELVSEFITREKRDYMAKSKWAIKGRDALSKDLGEIETTFCVSKGGPSAHAGELVPIFLVLRRQYNLPKSALPTAVIEPYLDILPAPPDPDDVPYREPSVATATAKLYVNPRLDDIAALEVLQELAESAREDIEASIPDQEEQQEVLVGMIEQIEKRFPDGSYEVVFGKMRDEVIKPSTMQPDDATAARPKAKQATNHRRAMSTAVSGSVREDDIPDMPRLPVPVLQRQLSHNRSASLPSRKSVVEGLGDAIDLASDVSSDDAPTPMPGAPMQKPVLPALVTESQPHSSQFLSPGQDSANRSSAGWWDVVSAVGDTRPSQPWRTSYTSSTGSDHPLPPGAEQARTPELSTPFDDSYNKLMLDFAARPPTSPTLSPAPTPMQQHSPARRAVRAQTVTGSPASARSDGSPQSAPPVSRPPPVPIKFDRPSFPSPSSANTSPSADRSPPPIKSKLGTFGRSLSIGKGMLARSREKDRDKDKDKDKEDKEVEQSGDKENEKLGFLRSKEKEKEKVSNSPGRWNKDMVANIMGPPADRK